MKGIKSLIISSSLAAIVIIAVFTMSFVMASANAGRERVPVTNQHGGVEVTIPAHAAQLADNVFSLGTAIVDGQKVEGLMIVDYKEEAARPDGRGGGKNKPSGKTKCYEFMARGAKWNSVEPWTVNTQNSQGLTSDYVLNNLSANIAKWEDASGTDILGNGTATTALLEADTLAPDGVNEVYFGSIDSPGAIAVTIVWGTFSGPPSGRELIEWDQVYDQVDFEFGNDGDLGKMDFESIATHELGHSIGMTHPESTCTEETMFAYAGLGETQKRDLHTGDMAGVSAMY